MGSKETATVEEARQLVVSGKLGNAETLLRQFVAEHPKRADPLTLLGIVLMRTNRGDEAGKSLEIALGENPEHLEALTWLAALRQGQRRTEEAIELIHRLLRLTPNNIEALNLQGNCYLAQGKASEAERSFRSAIGYDTSVAASYSNLGMALRLQNRGEEALEAFRTATRLSPEARNFLQLFKQLQQLSKWDEAVTVLQKGLVRHPNSVDLSEALALTLGRLNRGQEAEAIFRKVAAVSPSAANNYATWLQDAGRFPEAVEALKNSLRLRPIQGVAYRNLTEAKCFDLDVVSIYDAMNKVAAEPKLDVVERMHLSYAFGKLYEHRKQYELAMQSYDEANHIAYEVYPSCQTFDPGRTAREPELASQLYSIEFLERVRPFGSKDTRPIFVVGMIRSGTTLLEQIISSHPDVLSVGEPTFWNVESDTVHRRWAHANPTEGEMEAIASSYLRSANISPTTLRFTDKMPLNYRNLGLIHAVFPQARILHIRRDPFDTCLSIYSTFFGGGPNFTYNRENIVTFYRSYLQYMDHWRSTLPRDKFFEVDYEELVANSEQQIRKVLDFLGLQWNTVCLHHEQNKNQVTTPSRWQVRQPIYTASVGKKRNYGPFAAQFTEL